MLKLPILADRLESNAKKYLDSVIADGANAMAGPSDNITGEISGATAT